jgi:DNA-binding MarR family transcriptional regulator
MLRAAGAIGGAALREGAMRLDRPEELGPHLEESAEAWEDILGGVDAVAIGVFGRVEALARSWAALQRDVLAPFGLNHAELMTLARLRTSPPEGSRSPSELRRLVGQTSAGMTRILDKLESEQLVRRVSHAEDGRRIDVRLTARGTSLVEEGFRALLTAESDLLAPLGKRPREEVLRGLDALLSAFAERSVASDRAAGTS